MQTIEKYGFWFLVLAVVSEIALPFVLGAFTPNYSQINDLISTFGEDGGTTRIVFKIWQATNGTLFLLAIPAFYAYFKPTSSKLALGLAIMIAVFAIGDCWITALFDQQQNATGWKMIAGMIHEYGTGIGFSGLLIGIFLLWRLVLLQGQKITGMILVGLFGFALFFMLLFSWPRLPILNQWTLPYRGLWQRLNLLFLYLPYTYIALIH